MAQVCAGNAFAGQERQGIPSKIVCGNQVGQELCILQPYSFYRQIPWKEVAILVAGQDRLR